MELIFLGTSSALPTNKRNHPAIALKAFGEVMLFDCGEGTKADDPTEIESMKINQIFITHFTVTISWDCQVLYNPGLQRKNRTPTYLRARRIIKPLKILKIWVLLLIFLYMYMRSVKVLLVKQMNI
jgi:hypothetical protein